MRVLVNWTYSSDIIDCPVEIAENIKDYQNQFDTWLYDRNNQHGYWILVDFEEEGEDWGIEYGTDAIVKWLNENILAESEEKVKIIETQIIPTEEQKNILRFIVKRLPDQGRDVSFIVIS